MNSCISKDEDPHRYDDIIELPHHVSGTHPRMTAGQRAALFKSFMPLTGYSEKLEEAGRFTESRRVLDTDEKELLNQTLTRLRRCLDNEYVRPEVKVVYFVPDTQKAGGKYRTRIGRLIRIDEVCRKLILSDDALQDEKDGSLYRNLVEIPIDEISELDAEQIPADRNVF